MAVTAPVLVPARVVVVVTTRDSLGAVLRPDVAKLIESEPDAPTAEPEIEPPVPVVIDGEVIPPVMAIVPLLVDKLLTDATVHVPFGAVCAMADDAEISADVISSAKREVLFKVILVPLLKLSLRSAKLRDHCPGLYLNTGSSFDPEAF